MEVIRIANLESPQIQEFLAAQNFLPVQQTPLWARFQKSLGVASLRFVVFEQKKVVAFAQVFVRKLPLGLTRLEIPRAPLFHEAWSMEHGTKILDLLIAEITKFAREQKAIFARFDFQQNSGFASPKLRKAREENYPLATIRVDLAQSEPEILAQMKPKGRYNIRLAEKHGVQISAEKSVDTFFALLQKTTTRDGFSGHPKSFYAKLLEQLGENCALLTARQASKPLAAILVTFAGDTATYYFGASDHEFRNLMAPYLIQFEAMKIAKKRGCRFYDFLGVAPQNSVKHHLAGVSDFKKKFGGETVEYPEPRLIVFRPFFYALFRLAKFLRP
ncbi:MAG: peptidoglycan bridge formation glycyltransferase FemA/FemB family protein [Patescibacteria group bacterium]